MKKIFKEYIPQILLIVFSVVLGLFLNEKISERQEKKMAAQLVEHLKTEISHSRETFLKWMPYHQKLRIKVDSCRQEEAFINAFETNISEIYNLANQGVFNGSVNTTAWETALLNPSVSMIPYTQLRDLSKVYKQLETVTAPIGKISDLFSDGNFNNKATSKNNLHSLSRLLRELVGREYRLIIYCNVALGDTLVDQEHLIDSLVTERLKLDK